MAGMLKRRSGAREEPDPNFYASHPVCYESLSVSPKFRPLVRKIRMLVQNSVC